MGGVKIVTFWSTLIRLAKAWGDAKQQFGPDSWQAMEAHARLKQYESVCLRDDVEMHLGVRVGDL